MLSGKAKRRVLISAMVLLDNRLKRKLQEVCLCYLNAQLEDSKSTMLAESTMQVVFTVFPL